MCHLNIFAVSYIFTLEPSQKLSEALWSFSFTLTSSHSHTAWGCNETVIRGNVWLSGHSSLTQCWFIASCHCCLASSMSPVRRQKGHMPDLLTKKKKDRKLWQYQEQINIFMCVRAMTSAQEVRFEVTKRLRWKWGWQERYCGESRWRGGEERQEKDVTNIKWSFIVWNSHLWSLHF